jgi:hypothetical protein
LSPRQVRYQAALRSDKAYQNVQAARTIGQNGRWEKQQMHFWD